MAECKSQHCLFATNSASRSQGAAVAWNGDKALASAGNIISTNMNAKEPHDICELMDWDFIEEAFQKTWDKHLCVADHTKIPKTSLIKAAFSAIMDGEASTDPRIPYGAHQMAMFAAEITKGLLRRTGREWRAEDIKKEALDTTFAIMVAKWVLRLKERSGCQ
ncbi:Uu.00g143260.m01.CDS01 [Anthostomella pinea]|uniref:Uu.00g143260.m01.CDS01 n=1 Tax=Anthostomella pinea TaxID=933095 RepID=A0AAI8VQP0_9PEZI|nr:Uu.00g143260.m01.CDS01 [Anthostomella pinea]